MFRRLHPFLRSLETYVVLKRSLSLTPEFKYHFHFPLERLDQILDGSYPTNIKWISKWKAYLEQFHKLRIDQIKDMLYLCAKRKAMPMDLYSKLRSNHWIGKLAEAKGVELATVLYSIALLNESRQFGKGRMRFEPFVEGILKQAMQRKDLDRFSDAALAQCLYAFAMMSLKRHSLIEMYSIEMIHSKRRHKLKSRITANVLWAWARLNYQNEDALEAISKRAMKTCASATEQELTNLVWAWGVLGYKDLEVWNEVLKEIEKRIEKMSQQGLTMVLTASARAGHRKDVDLAFLLKHIVDGNQHRFYETRYLANMVWALGKIQYPKKDMNLHSLVQESLKTSRLEEASIQELCCLVLGISRLNYQNLEGCTRLQETILQPRRLKAMNLRELCNLIWAFGKMTVSRDSVQKALAIELVSRQDAFDQISSQGFIQVVMGWAYGGFDEKEERNVVLREVMKNKRLKEYNPQELTNLCWAFGKMGIHSYNLFHRLTETILQPDRLTLCSFQGLTHVLMGWAKGRYHDPQAIDAILHQLHQKSFKEAKAQEIVNVCWSLGKLRYQNESVVHEFALEATRSERLEAYSALQMSMILLGWSKSQMFDFRLWDQILSQISTEENSTVIDMPVYHNLSQAIQSAGFTGILAYQTARRKGEIMMTARTRWDGSSKTHVGPSGC